MTVSATGGVRGPATSGVRNPATVGELASVPLLSTLGDGTFTTLLVWFGWVVLAYFLLVNGSYLFVHVAGLLGLRSELNAERASLPFNPHASPFPPGLAIVVPAYDEAPVVVDSVRSLLGLEYPTAEVIVVDDGSTDDTLARLQSAFDLHAVDETVPLELPCEPVREVYRAAEHDLTVVSKDNGGKADALNAGLFLTDQPLFCAVDADAIVERTALLSVVEPFLRDPTTVAVGGGVRVANGCDFAGGRLQRVALSSSRLARVQTMEYLRAFLAGRVGFAKLRSLLIISGAFGVFDTRAVREIGGYDRGTVTEDLDLVVRLHRHCRDAEREYAVRFLSEPVVWTEVPETPASFARQRRRWYRGLCQTLWRHRDAIGRPRYGVVGLVALPFFLVVEALGPLVEGVGYLLVPILLVLGVLEVPFFVAFLAVAVVLGLLLSWLSVLGEAAGFKRYDEPRQLAVLLAYGVLEHVLVRQWKTLLAWQGLLEFLRKRADWGAMPRLGFER